jgi:hypothetical protein
MTDIVVNGGRVALHQVMATSDDKLVVLIQAFVQEPCTWQVCGPAYAIRTVEGSFYCQLLVRPDPHVESFTVEG